MPDFGFHNIRILIETPDRAFEGGKIKLLREACDTLAAARAFEE
jgi:hypothetical protein